MEKICVYTVITGNYDDICEIDKEKGIDYYCFTNNKNIKSNSWKIIHIEDKNLDNQRLSRKIKMIGHPIINEYDVCVYMDASVRFKKSIKEFIQKYLKNNSFAAFKHSYRDCIYDEAMECIKLRKDDKKTILKTVNFLRKNKFPEHYGLYEMTVFIKRPNDKKVRETMNLWFDFICNYSKRDQLSFMYCIYKTGLKVSTIPLSVWNNDWFDNVKHNYKKELKDCRIYFGNDLNYNPDCDINVNYKVKDNHYKINTKVLNDTNEIEIQLTDIPCIEFSELKIDGLKVKDMFIFNYIEMDKKTIFYGDGIIKLVGQFKKNDKLNISVDFKVLNEIEKIEFIDYLSQKVIIANSNIDNLNHQINHLNEETNNLKIEMDKIINSKAWKIITFMRKIIKR